MKLFYIARAAAKKKRVSYNKIAKVCGVSKSTITRYMTGKNDLMGETVCRLFSALGIDLYHHVYFWSVYDPANPKSLTEVESEYVERLNAKKGAMEASSGSGTESITT